MSPVQTPILNTPPPEAPRRQRSWWPYTIALSIIILLAGSWFLWLPQWQEGKAVPPVIGFEDSRRAVQAELDSLKKLTTEYEKLTATDLLRLDLALPRGQDIPNLLAQLEGVAEAANFTIKEFSFSATKNSATLPIVKMDEEGNVTNRSFEVAVGPQEIKINLGIVGGDYMALKKFIATAEKSIKLLQLSSVTFNSRTTDGQKSDIIYVLNFRTVYLPQ